jgi:hypothetical protein
MRWNAYFHPKFKAEFDKLSNSVQDELIASLNTSIAFSRRGAYDARNGFG